MTFTFLHCNCLAVCSNISVAFRQPDQQHIQQTLLKTNFWVGFYSDDCIENDTYICLCRLVRNTLVQNKSSSPELSYWEARGGRVNEGRVGHLKILQQVANFADNANGATRWPNFEPIHVVLSLGQICNLCKWRHLVAKCATNASDATWWANLQLMQVEPSGGGRFHKPLSLKN